MKIEPLPPPPLLKKVTPLFPSYPPQKVEILSSPPLLKIWLDVHPPRPPPFPQQQKGGCTLCIRSWRAENAPKLSLKYLKDRIWKIKQHLNYILMIINQNTLAIPRTFLNLKKKIMKRYTKWTSTAATTELVCKIPNRKKISNEHFHLYETEISLDEIIKSVKVGKVVLTSTLLEWLVVMHINFDKNTGGKTSKIKWLFASNLILSIFIALQALCSTRFTPGLQLQRQLNYTKCLVPDIVSNTENGARKKQTMDLNPRCSPGHI